MTDALGKALLFLCLAAAGLALPVRLSHPLGVPPAQSRTADLDGDGIPERYTLADERLTVVEKGHVIWRSPADWRVVGFVIADSTNAGRPALNLVVWKKGSYGAYRPFWFKGPDDAYTCHLYVFDLSAGAMKPVWMSSAIEPPILHLKICRATSDGRNDLVVTEAAGPGKATRTTVWRWDAWDFYRTARHGGWSSCA